jgi:dipeptidyl aminopeptidase/acylaminoacyl peptidase
VDFTQGVEYYNTLRRLGKPVIMLEYTGENHGLARARRTSGTTPCA